MAEKAETCFFCGHDLTKPGPGKRQVTWLDLALVVALLALVAIWWQMGNRSDRPNAQTETQINTPTPVITTPQNEAAAVAILTTATPISESEPTPGPLLVIHTVQSGETLSAIAIQYGVTVETIQAANGLKDSLIRAGSELVIPVPQVVSEITNQVEVPSIFRYTVQPGDTVVSIAVRFGATVEGILKASGIVASDFIRPEQVLRIPVELPPGVAASSESARNVPGLNNSAGGYAAARLLEPGDGVALPRGEEVIFRWISVDLLAPNEWYVLRIWPVEGSVGLLPAVWTKATSHRLHPDAVPVTSAAMQYGWQVTVVRILPDQGEGRGIQAASVPSDVRNFTWR
ncbi:MAG: LysM peptidoglycan-binding domain-containing protein [Caldilineaceae bacterium]|nr:LysM peptidoglycan-binding domain-containing protein [Caldilineaceae bacterium]HRJ40698.1 LysM peptidoglycan-binding domain-containing protein [Caldilineaceae bacterium]